MSEKGRPPEAESAGLVRSLRAFLSACASYASARLRLASAESREAAGEAGKLLAVVCAIIFAAMFGWMFLCLAVVSLLAGVLGEHGWIWASLIVAAGHFAIATALVVLLKLRGAKPFFPLTTAEFQKDREWLDREAT